jgi:copper transport protein
VFLALMTAIGLYVLRMLIARPVVRRVRGVDLRWVSTVFVATSVAALFLIPFYALLSTAKFALRSVFAVDALLPLVRTSSFGRGYLDLELVFALFVLAALVSLWLDRPERERRSIAELLAVGSALAAAAAATVLPGVAGHAGQTAPRLVAIPLDAVHVAAGSVWIGGLLGLLVLWLTVPSARRTAALVVAVPRFSNVAFVSVLALIGTGIGASLLHMPTVATFWTTSYGQALLVKIALLSAALLLAAVNLLRTKPRLEASRRRPELASPTAYLLRRLVSAEVVLVAAAVFAAAILTSVPPPAKALAQVKNASARVGPGPVRRVVTRNGYRLEVNVRPNKAVVPNTFDVRITRNGQPVRGADVSTRFTMLDMAMGDQAYALKEVEPGLYRHSAPALVMVGHWGLTFDVRPRGARPFDVLLVDKANG